MKTIRNMVVILLYGFPISSYGREISCKTIASYAAKHEVNDWRLDNNPWREFIGPIKIHGLVVERVENALAEPHMVRLAELYRVTLSCEGKEIYFTIHVKGSNKMFQNKHLIGSKLVWLTSAGITMIADHGLVITL